ncbi:molybdopterin molybdotransferase MoeA [Flavihumibacter sp. UBA7668]|uniref:molybdopterin molybdotransferase MoeA n=1 Tax=Flavihumibacter sp. UBA7668 TaxID=1946542 RepID=UPI0025C1C6F7|nr:molybdopterin molybdotransferase MoeA [Flavihumibacter sp. UBA7668]
MVTVQEAKQLIRENSQKLDPVEIPLIQAAGLILAQDFIAPIDIPSFPQSGMDGYAFAFDSYKPGSHLEIIGEMAAGVHEMLEIPAGKAVRIFTGAPVPNGTDTVVMQEKTSRKDQFLSINFPEMKKGDNVRPKGSEIGKNALALPKGSLLSPAALGFLAGMGATNVWVYPAPSIALLVTGNELQQPGKPLAYGQVYESNSIAIQAALQKIGLSLQKIYTVHDSLEQLTNVLNEAIDQHDLILLTGGISVGDYDFTLPATESCKVEQLFHKISQKPGKPIYAGKKGRKIVLALPGNPASVLTCFYEYVTEAVSVLMQKNIRPEIKIVPAAGPFTKKAALAFFLKGYYDGELLHFLPAQESYKLNSFAQANCLVFLPAESIGVEKGDQVEIHLIQ